MIYVRTYISMHLCIIQNPKKNSVSLRTTKPRLDSSELRKERPGVDRSTVKMESSKDGEEDKVRCLFSTYIFNFSYL